MWICANKMQQICTKLELKLNSNQHFGKYLPVVGTKGAVAFELDAAIKHIYEKFFMENVSEPKNVEKDLEYHFRSTLSTDIRTNQKDMILPSPDDIWIFGYGSLVWKADFPFIDRRRGFICGYKRRFYQHSIDHRGTSVRPGRVVTLLATNDKEDRVYGVAYRIAAQQKRKVLRHLDYREKNGYKRCSVRFYDFPEAAGARLMIIMYIATRENESYAGDVTDLNRIARQIFTSSGPSGTNREYLFKLATAMRVLFPGVHDEHLFSLEKAVHKLIDTDEDKAIESGLKKEIAVIVTSSIKGEGDVNVDKIVRRLEVLKNWIEKPGSRETLLNKAVSKLTSDDINNHRDTV